MHRLLCLALLPIILAAAPACAAPKPADPSAPAVVNLDRVLVEYRKSSAFGKYGARIRDRARIYEEEMKNLAQLRYATDQEREEALALLAKEKRLPKEQARLDELTKKADLVDNEMAMLSQKSAPTEAETKRIQEISQLRNASASRLAQENAVRQQNLRRMESDLLGEVEVELLKLVEKVAKERKLSHVYSHKAVLYGAQDLTDEVIKRVPK